MAKKIIRLKDIFDEKFYTSSNLDDYMLRKYKHDEPFCFSNNEQLELYFSWYKNLIINKPIHYKDHLSTINKNYSEYISEYIKVNRFVTVYKLLILNILKKLILSNNDTKERIRLFRKNMYLHIFYLTNTRGSDSMKVFKLNKLTKTKNTIAYINVDRRKDIFFESIDSINKDRINKLSERFCVDRTKITIKNLILLGGITF